AITIASVQGAALAGGAGVVAACDYVIAEKNAQFGFPEVLRGLVASQVMPLLKKQISLRKLRELLLFGQTISAEEASQYGLVNKVVLPEHLAYETLLLADRATQGSP